MLEALLLSILIFIVIIQIVLGLKRNTAVKISSGIKKVESSILKFEAIINRIESVIKDEFQRNRIEINDISKSNREELSNSLISFQDHFSKRIKDTIAHQLERIRNNNEKHLTEIRKTVDEKLQNTLEKRLGETFKQVSDRLEQVHRGLGEMQNIASGVGDLKKVLSNVKTRGVLGEYQLGNILEEILTPDQYGKNIMTKEGSQSYVEYAIKLPGKQSDEDVWMPVDSKFPIESYESLLDSYDEGIPQKIETTQKLLVKSIEGFAKDISTKYIDPPNTTDFCIMFLPIESLYAEVLRHPGLFEILQRKYKVTITGPTTLSALLNSLQMGFRTLAVQKRSSEVWRILGAVKTEFGKFTEQLSKVQKQINTASGSLEALRVTRTNQIERKLCDVQKLDTIISTEILELPNEKSNLEKS